MSKIKEIKKMLFEAFYSDKYKSNFLYYIDDYVITTLIVLNVFAIIAESFDYVHDNYHTQLHIFEVFSVIIFSLEYLLRFWVADLTYPNRPKWRSRLKYVFSTMGLIDLLAIIPFYLPWVVKLDLRFLRVLRLFRLVRIFKMAHYSLSIRMLAKIFNDKRRELFITLIGSFVLILLSSSIMFEFEHDVQPDKFPNIFATFWWAVATLTTIGYGDVYPVTAIGQFLAALVAIFGIGLIAIPTGIISAGFLEELQKTSKGKNHKPSRKKYVPTHIHYKKLKEK